MKLDDKFKAFHAGEDEHAYRLLGALPEGDGFRFSVWAPEADQVSVIGDFNLWDDQAHRLERVTDLGVWSATVPRTRAGQRYKYRIRSRNHGVITEKADPFGRAMEEPPRTASVLADIQHPWGDARWLDDRAGRQRLSSPMSIYELHLGSWRRVPEEGNRFLTYRELAPQLCEYVRRLGFTHVELMPVMEHPFYGSWGYQIAGYFSATRRYGPPEDLMYLIDQLHQSQIGVILDWVPAHFPADAHGLGSFDGSHLFEHADRRQGFHPEWNSLVFNYGRNEVRSFLMSSALYWLDQFHADGLRVDGVASMLYLDYARRPGEWVPNRYGGRENLEAMSFLRRLNEKVYGDQPSVQTIAEESTAWPMVSQPTSNGGLGFGFKWDMGWMHDTLDYFEKDPIYRQYNHARITFRSLYAFSEHFVLPLSHDEVVYGKKSLLEKMPGDDWQKFANLRLLFATQWAQPGKKLLFMGGEFAQRQEWDHDRSLDWHLLDHPWHRAMSLCVGELNRLYRQEPALHVYDDEAAGFEWIDGSNAKESVLVFLRKGARPADDILVALNYTPVPRAPYRVGIPRLGTWKEIFNSDAKEFGGSGSGNLGALEAAPAPWNGRRYSLDLTLPPLGAVMLKSAAGG